ncbi:MAG: type II CAAX prenyl endopeptidase Rce1 family protein [bacterium]
MQSPIEPEEKISTETTDDATIIYSGSWERGNRSLNTAAVLGLLGIGVLYFNAQTLLALLSVGISYLFGAVEQSAASEEFYDALLANLQRFAQPIRIALVISQYVFMLLPALWLVKRWHTLDVRAYIRLKKSAFAEILLAAIATVAIMPAGSYIANELSSRLNIPDFLIEINAVLFRAHSPLEFVWLVFAIAVTPAICEEIFFRGYVQRTFERTIGAKSVIVIGVIFGLFHMQPVGLVTLAMLGLLFGYFYYRSKSLLPSMAAHFANNFIVVLILYKAPQLSGVDLATSQQFPIAWVVLTLPVALACLYFFHKITSHNASRE